MKHSHVLLATLGGQPQVISFALDILMARGETIDEVVVVHLGGERYVRALRRLSEAFVGDRYHDHPCHLRPLPVRLGGNSLLDVQNEQAVTAVWHTLYGVINQLKQEQAHLHLLLTGGRRLMALLAVSAAMLRLEPGDHVWHLYTPEAVQAQARDGALLHVQPEAGVRLLEVPIAPLGSYFPAIRTLTSMAPEQVLATHTQWLAQEERARCQAVWERLTPQQRVVLRAFASGASRKQVAEELSLSLRTVDAHKTVILAECRIAWALPEAERIDYHFIERQFKTWLPGLR